MVFPYNPTLTINDLYPIIRALESTWQDPMFVVQMLVLMTMIPVQSLPFPFLGIVPGSSAMGDGSSMWQLTFRLGRHLKYTCYICAKSFWGDMTTVAIPHIMPGWSWRLMLFHARLCGRRRDLIQSAQLYPFFAISPTCVPPPDKGPQFTPSIRDVSSFFNVGIGSEVPSGSGTLK